MKSSIADNIYSFSPAFLQNVLCSIHGYKEKKKRFGPHFMASLEFLSDSQYWSKQQIEEHKEQSFSEIIQHCYNTVPYYKKLFKLNKLTPADIKSLEDINKIPVLTKEILHTNFKDFVSSAYPATKIIHSHTSGSTGKALEFYTTLDTIQFQWAVWWRFRERFGIKLGDKHLNFTGKLVVPISQTKPPFWRYNKAINQHLVNMQHIKPENIQALVNFINREKFIFFSGYPSIIYSFCSLAEQQGLKITNSPKYVFTGAEKLYENQRETIARVLGAVVTDQYGFSEGAGNASRCSLDKFHEDFEFGHIECYGPIRTTEDGSEGQILATGFKNFAMPLIRYQVGDFATFSNKSCNCGLHSKTLENIEGRKEDFILTPEGTKILRFDYLFKDSHSIQECQVVQYKEGEVTFKIVKRSTYKEKDEQGLIDGVRKWISPTIKVNFEYVNEIERTVTGKFRAVMSYLKENQVE